MTLEFEKKFGCNKVTNFLISNFTLSQIEGKFEQFWNYYFFKFHKSSKNKVWYVHEFSFLLDSRDVTGGGVRIFSGLKPAFPTKFGHKIVKKCEKKIV